MIAPSSLTVQTGPEDSLGSLKVLGSPSTFIGTCGVKTNFTSSCCSLGVCENFHLLIHLVDRVVVVSDPSM